MDRIWQWAWDRYGARYSWAICAIGIPLNLPIYLFWSFLIVAIEESNHYVEAAAVTVVGVVVLVYMLTLPGRGRIRLVEQWAAGHEVDRAKVLAATYAFARGAVVRVLAFNAVGVGLLSVVVGAIAGAAGSRLVQYGSRCAQLAGGRLAASQGCHRRRHRDRRRAAPFPTELRRVVERVHARSLFRILC